LGLLREIVLAYSEEDELVEKEQVEEMERKLKEGGWGGDAKGKVYLKELSGGHDFIWEDGRQVVGLVEETVNRILGL
jgi:surfactin synthase thioesterase subunit